MVRENVSRVTVKGIAIGVIGPDILAQKIQQALKSFPSFEPVIRVYEDEDELPDIADALAKEVEVLLFSGYRAFRKVMDRMTFHIPVHYIPLTGSGIYSALFRLKNRCGLTRLSVDSLSKDVVKQTLQDLDEAITQMTVFPGVVSPTEDEMIRFHRELFLKGKSAAALTGEKAVYETLTRMGIPSEWVIPTQQDMIVSLERALLSTQARRDKESQIVVGLINVDKFRRLIDNSVSEHEIQKLKLDIERLILDYVQTLEGHLTNLGGGEYLFFTTRGIFERETRGYKFMPLLDESKTLLDVSLSIGIGFGQSANEAGTHARMALRQSKEMGGDVCYIVREDKCVIGPVETGPPMVYDLAVTDEKLLKKAEKAGMTPTYMSKLLAQVSRLGKIDYTAQELVPILGVTIRSTHRILLQWLDAGLVRVVGLEKIATKGRPRQIYRLSFIEEEGLLEKELLKKSN